MNFYCCLALWPYQPAEYSLEAKISSSYPVLQANPSFKFQFMAQRHTYLSCTVILNSSEKGTPCGFVSLCHTQVCVANVKVTFVVFAPQSCLGDVACIKGLIGYSYFNEKCWFSSLVLITQ